MLSFDEIKLLRNSKDSQVDQSEVELRLNESKEWGLAESVMSGIMIITMVYLFIILAFCWESPPKTFETSEYVKDLPYDRYRNDNRKFEMI